MVGKAVGSSAQTQQWHQMVLVEFVIKHMNSLEEAVHLTQSIHHSKWPKHDVARPTRAKFTDVISDSTL